MIEDIARPNKCQARPCHSFNREPLDILIRRWLNSGSIVRNNIQSPFPASTSVLSSTIRSKAQVGQVLAPVKPHCHLCLTSYAAGTCTQRLHDISVFCRFVVAGRLTLYRISTSHQKVVLEIDFSGLLFVCPSCDQIFPNSLSIITRVIPK